MRSSRATLRQTQTFTWDVIYISIGPPDNPMFFYENDKTFVVVGVGVAGGGRCRKTPIFIDNLYMNLHP